MLVLGVAFGLAVSSKISVLSFLLIIGLAYLLRIWWPAGRRPGRCGASTAVAVARALGPSALSCCVSRLTPTAGRRRQLSGWCPVAVGGGRASAAGARLVAALASSASSSRRPLPGPGFFDLKLNPKWKDNMDYISKLVSGEIDYPPSHQWTAREPVWYMLKNMVLWGHGAAPGAGRLGRAGR